MCAVECRNGGGFMDSLKQVSVHELYAKLGTVNLIEVRESCEVNGGKIPTSEIILGIGIRMNHSVFLDKNKEYYVATLGNYDDIKLVEFLQKEGYQVINVIGGTMEYKKHYLLEYLKKSDC